MLRCLFFRLTNILAALILTGSLASWAVISYQFYNDEMIDTWFYLFAYLPLVYLPLFGISMGADFGLRSFLHPLFAELLAWGAVFGIVPYLLAEHFYLDSLQSFLGISTLLLFQLFILLGKECHTVEIVD